MTDKFNKYKYIIVCAICLVIGIFLFGTKHPESSILFFVPIWIIFVIKDYYKNKYTNKIFMAVVVMDIISLFAILMKSDVPIYIRYILFYVVVVTLLVVIPLIAIKFIRQLPDFLLNIKQKWDSKRINSHLPEFLFEYHWDNWSPYSVVDYCEKEKLFDKKTKKVLNSHMYKYMAGYEIFLAVKSDLDILKSDDLLNMRSYLNIINDFTKEKEQWYRRILDVVGSLFASVLGIKWLAAILASSLEKFPLIKSLFSEMFNESYSTGRTFYIYWGVFVCGAIIVGMVAKILSDYLEMKRRKNLGFFLQTVVEKILSNRGVVY